MFVYRNHSRKDKEKDFCIQQAKVLVSRTEKALDLENRKEGNNISFK